MVVIMGCSINIEGQSQFAISLQACTLIVAFQRLLEIALATLGRIASRLLLDTLALASNKDLMLARLVLFARER